MSSLFTGRRPQTGSLGLPEPCALDAPIPQDGPYGLNDPNDPKYNANHELYWAYGKGAGGFELTFPKYKGTPLHKAPYRYLKWGDGRLTDARTFREAFRKYREGLVSRVPEDYASFRVTLGKKHRGKKIGECRDKAWLEWLCEHAHLHGALKQKYMHHDVFFMALCESRLHPRRQNVHRDLGESTEDRGRFILDPSEYEDDLAEDANENGDLEGFVVSDSQGLEAEDDPDALTDREEACEEEMIRMKTLRRKGKDKRGALISPEPESVEDDSDCNEEEVPKGLYNELEVDDESPLKTSNLKRRAKRALIGSQPSGSSDMDVGPYTGAYTGTLGLGGLPTTPSRKRKAGEVDADMTPRHQMGNTGLLDNPGSPSKRKRFAAPSQE